VGYRLCVAPIVLVGGNPLLRESPDWLKLTLAGARPLNSGGVIVYYQRGTAKAP
jgi:hypothetical protein